MVIVRYADDFIVGFQHEADARRFLDTMREGIVTLTNDRRDKSRTQSRLYRSRNLAPCLHGRGSECPVRLC